MAASDLIVEDVEFYMVWTKRGRIPRFVHSTLAEAEAEADRLAGLKPHGKKYIVLRALRKCHFPSSDIPDSSPNAAVGARVHSQQVAA